MNDVITYEYSDAWLLLGIMYASKFGENSADMLMIISSCDYIQHSMISFDELKGGFFRLRKNDYIFEKGHLKFTPSQSVISRYKDYLGERKRKSVMKDLEFVANLVKAKKWVSKYDFKKANEKYSYKELTEEIVTDAYNKYAKFKVQTKQLHE